MLFLDRQCSSYANPMEEDSVDKILAKHSINFQYYFCEMLYLIIVFFNAVFWTVSILIMLIPRTRGLWTGG